MTTEPACRICYDGDQEEPLISPCDCKGSIQWSHRRCLYEWLAIDGRDSCELCTCVYFFDELVLESVYEPRDFRVLRLVRWTHLLLIFQILLYILYLLVQPPQRISPWELESRPAHTELSSIGRAIPYMLLILAGVQMIVLVPAIRILRDKYRYLRYLIQSPGLRLNPLVFLSISLISFLMSFYLPVASAGVYVQFLSYFYDVHCNTVHRINKDVLQAYYLS